MNLTNKGISTQVLDAMSIPELALASVENPVFRTEFIKQFLTSKKVKFVSKAQKDQVFSEKSGLLFPEYLEFYNNLTKKDVSEGKYKDLKDAYNVSEFFAPTNRFRVSTDYLKYIKSSKDGFVINIYGYEKSSAHEHIWEDTEENLSTRAFSRGEIPEAKFATPGAVKYSKFTNDSYRHDLLIESCMNPVPTACLNLPWEYYSSQNIPANIFTWDVDKEEYSIGGRNIGEINKWIIDIAKGGIKDPLVMRISGGLLCPLDETSSIILFIATYLNLPTIPVVLYMSEEAITKNPYMEEIQKVVFSKDLATDDALGRVNKATKPHFLFEVSDGSDDRAFLTVGRDNFHKTQYPAINDIDDKTLMVFDRYLDPNIQVEKIRPSLNPEEQEAEIAKIHEELKKELDAKLKKEDECVVEKILAGEYDHIQ